MENYYLIYITDTDGKTLVDVVWMKNYTREEAFATLNRVWNKHEKEGKFYTYELTDTQNNSLFKNYR